MSDAPVHSELAELRLRVPASVGSVLLEAAELGFLGSMPIPDQVDHALGFAFCVESERSEPPESMVDLGSGGGLPGLVLAACWTDARVVLIDSSERRSIFLESAVDRLFRGDRARVSVERARAEDFARGTERRGEFEVVTARSFGSPAVTAECAAPLLKMAGALVVSEPPDSDSLERWPAAGLAELGLMSGASVRFDGRFNFQMVDKRGPTPDRYPRRIGVPTKRPLF
jgi:16S rRNA (guanine527-N7)-methyltransferase